MEELLELKNKQMVLLHVQQPKHMVFGFSLNSDKNSLLSFVCRTDRTDSGWANAMAGKIAVA